MRVLPIEGWSRTPLRPKYSRRHYEDFVSDQGASRQHTKGANEGAGVLREGQRITPEEPLQKYEDKSRHI